jgi:predicted permease
MLAESMLLSTGGAVLGMVVVYAATGALASLAPVDLPRVGEIRVDLRVWLFAGMTSSIAGVIIGIVCAWRHPNVGASGTLLHTEMARTSPPRSRFRTILVTGEVAASLVCLVLAGLLLRSLDAVLHEDKGFAADRLVTVDLRLPVARYPDLAATSRFIDGVLSGVESVPGVSGAAVSNILPLGGEGANNVIFVEGAVDRAAAPVADIRMVNAEYFATLGIPTFEGATFDSTSRERRVALVSQSAASRLWPGRRPVGERFRVGDSSGPPIEVIGVVGDVRGSSLEKSPTLTVYVPYWQAVRGNRTRLSLAAHVQEDPRAIAGSLTATIHRVDADLAVPPFRTMDQMVDEAVAMRRFQTNLVVLFGASALLLSAIGLYGVVASAVAQQRKDIAVRITLGAARQAIVRLVLTDALRPLVIGLLIGVPSALAVSTFIRSLLYGVVPQDLITFVIGCVLISLTTIGAAIIPTRRALQVDPASTLRSE